MYSISCDNLIHNIGSNTHIISEKRLRRCIHPALNGKVACMWILCVKFWYGSHPLQKESQNSQVNYQPAV